ncbi:MAG: hypothetical protein LBU32_24825 [Clostridiales bacterium]|nr:hypothetical protein [Clostridiales bacterium]
MTKMTVFGQDIAIKNITSPIPGLADAMFDFVSTDSAGDVLSELNYLASKIIDMDGYVRARNIRGVCDGGASLRQCPGNFQHHGKPEQL